MYEMKKPSRFESWDCWAGTMQMMLSMDGFPLSSELSTSCKHYSKGTSLIIYSFCCGDMKASRKGTRTPVWLHCRSPCFPAGCTKLLSYGQYYGAPNQPFLHRCKKVMFFLHVFQGPADRWKDSILGRIAIKIFWIQCNFMFESQLTLFKNVIFAKKKKKVLILDDLGQVLLSWWPERR